MTDTFSISAISQLFGHDRRKVTRLLDGVEPVHQDGRSRSYTARQYLDALLGDLVADDGTLLDPQQERAALDRVRRALAEQELARRSGELIPADMVERVQGGMVSAFRARCLAIPTKAAPLLIGNDEFQAASLLRDLVDEALEELSEFDPVPYMNARDAPPDAGATGDTQ